MDGEQAGEEVAEMVAETGVDLPVSIDVQGMHPATTTESLAAVW
jgi:hypothetical protein